ncbi:addiction module antidote protein, HigA family [Tenuifilaceae bacterium CYCD]|nr:addiction module antidote protein, HigA family [Tenuifilaceae bacterium CYCD]
MSKVIIPHIATHPGEVLKDEIDAREMNYKDFAFQIGMQPTMLSEIMNGKRSVTADIAILLEKALDISAKYWMDLQSQFEIDEARIKEKNIVKLRSIEQWKLITELVPYKILTKLGYLVESVVDDIQTVKEIYNVSDVKELQVSFATYKLNSKFNFRKSSKLQVDDVNLFCWSNLVMWKARNEKVNEFRLDSIDNLIFELNQIFYQNRDVVNRTKDTLTKYGIKFVILEKLDKTPVDGFSFWSNENPAIGVSMRYRNIDNFAFTVLHELGHIVKHIVNDKSNQFIDVNEEKEKSSCQKEVEADEFSQNKLIPLNQWVEIKDEVPITKPRILSFSQKHRINPAIVRGRFCWELGRYNIHTDIEREIH